MGEHGMGVSAARIPTKKTGICFVWPDLQGILADIQILHAYYRSIVNPMAAIKRRKADLGQDPLSIHGKTEKFYTIRATWDYFLRIRLNSLVSAGTISKMSPTMPYVATLKMGASGSLLIARMTFDDCIPMRCCIWPLIPHAMYNFGQTVFPVCPT